MFYRKTKQLENKTQILILLLLIILIPQLSLDLYLPALPSMQIFFHTTSAHIQWTLLIYLIGTSISQIIYGPIIDRYGRRPIVLFVWSLFFIASLGCIKTQNIYAFLAWRLLQGHADAGIYVVYRAVMQDLYKDKKLSKVFSYSSMIWISIPMLAPLLGAYIQHHFGWQMNLILIFILSGLSLLCVWRYFPETLAEKSREKAWITAYLRILKTRTFILGIMGNVFNNTIMTYIFVLSPFIMQIGLHLSPVDFAWTMAFIVGAYSLGSFLNASLIEKHGQKKLMSLSALAFILGTLSLCSLAYLNQFTVAAILLPLTSLYLGMGIAYPNFLTQALKNCQNHAGMAGALQGTLQTGLAVLLSLPATYLPHNNIKILSLIFLIMTCIILSINWALKNDYST